MNTYNSPLFGTLPSPSSFEDFFPLLHKPRGYRAVRMWRGQGNIDWPVHSTAYRRIASEDSGDVTERNMQFYEKDLLLRAEHKGFRHYHGRELSDFELLARLRHHGASTRFVDATRSALIGLWFCISEIPDRTGLLLGVHCDLMGGYEGQPENRPYDDIFKELPTAHPQTWEPSNVTARVAAQHSQFLYSPVCRSKAGSLALPERNDDTLCIAISPDFKEVCKKVLSEVYDLRQETLFPDLDGFGIANSAHSPQWNNYRW